MTATVTPIIDGNRRRHTGTETPVTIPPAMIGEYIDVLLMSRRGTHLHRAEVTEVIPAEDDWQITALLTEQRATFALVPTEDEPLDRECSGCQARPGEGCRLGCLEMAYTPVVLTGQELALVRSLLNRHVVGNPDTDTSHERKLIHRLNTAELNTPPWRHRR